MRAELRADKRAARLIARIRTPWPETLISREAARSGLAIAGRLIIRTAGRARLAERAWARMRYRRGGGRDA